MTPPGRICPVDSRDLPHPAPARPVDTARGRPAAAMTRYDPVPMTHSSRTARGPGMSGTDGARARAGGPAAARPSANRAATVSGFFALGGFASLANFATGIAWLNPGVFLGMAMVCALIAIPAGHVGRFRGRRPGGSGRGLSLAAILTGWAVLIVCLLAILAFVGLVAGATFLMDRT